jgi:hypothetical protein
MQFLTVIPSPSIKEQIYPRHSAAYDLPPIMHEKSNL